MGNEVSAKPKDETNVPVMGDGVNSTNALQTTTINHVNSLNEEDRPSNNHSISTSTLNDSAPAAGSVGVSSSSKGIVVVRRRDEVTDRRLTGQDELERIAGIPRFTPIFYNSLSTAHSLPWPSHGSIGSPVTNTVAASNTIISGASSTQQVYSAGAFTINNSRALHQPRNSISSSKPFRRTPSLSEEGHVDYKGILLLAARYQEHLLQCAEAVTFDQNALCVSMKDVDNQLQALASTLSERQRKYARLMEQLRKVSEMRRVLSKMRTSADNIGRAVDEMNSRLPPNLQLESFCFLPNAEDTFQETA